MVLFRLIGQERDSEQVPESSEEMSHARILGENIPRKNIASPKALRLERAEWLAHMRGGKSEGRRHCRGNQGPNHARSCRLRKDFGF